MNISLITPDQASHLVEQKEGVFVDVRTVGEALEEQLPGSLFLPFDLVNKKRLQQMGVSAETPILVCRSGSRAKQAAETLAIDQNKVAVLDGGIERWKKEGFSVDKGRKTIPLERQVLVAAGSMMLLFTILGLVLSPLFYMSGVCLAILYLLWMILCRLSCLLCF